MTPEGVGIQPLEHLATALAAAVLVVQLWSRPEARTARALLWAAGLALTPLLFALAPESLGTFVLGKEGAGEALTAGVLGALLVVAARNRQAWVGLGAVLLLLEELDYGQIVSGIATPEWLAAAGSHSGNLNTHNLPGVEAAWRLVPLLACAALALRERWPPGAQDLAASLRLPQLHPAFLPAAGALLVGAVASAALVSGDQADEAAELSAVVLVALAWRAEER